MAEILIVGTGAMALFFGARMAAGGNQITLLGSWEEGIRVVNESGIRVAGDQSAESFPARATRDAGDLPAVKLALVLVKSWQTERAGDQLSTILAPDGIALTLQNGLGNREILSKILGENRVAVGVTTYGATLLGPGLVRPGGDGVISVQRQPALAPLVQALRQSHFSLQEVENISGLVWSKLIINVAINPLTALLEVKNGGLLEDQSARKLMGLAAGEAARVADLIGVELGYSDPAQAAEAVSASTAENISSMLQDIRRGAPTEIEAMCGAVVRSGRSRGLETPVNEILRLMIRAKEGLSRKDGNENR